MKIKSSKMLIIATGLMFTSVSNAQDNNKSLKVENDIKTSGVVERVVDANEYIISIENNIYREIKDYARQESNALRYLNDDLKTVTVTLSNIDVDLNLEVDQDLPKKYNVSQYVKDLIEEKEVKLSCYNFDVFGKLTCNLNFEYDNKRVDLTGFLIANKLSIYDKRFGENPYLHELYEKVSKL